MLDINQLSKKIIIGMFTGQGALVPGAAKALYETNTVFKKALDQYTDVLKNQIDVSLLDLLIRNDYPNAGKLLQETQYAQPALVALQLAQVSMWQALGIKPSVVLGHSIGEFAAAATAGILQFEDAVKLAAIRGRLMSECRPGSMAAILLPAEHLQPLPLDIVIAAENGPSLTVIAGPQEALHDFVKRKFNNTHTLLPVSHAFHSPLMEAAAHAFRNHINNIKISESQNMHFISTLSGDIETKKIQTPDYWVDQIIQPVKFLRAVKTAFSLSPAPEAIIEMGPTSTLINMAKRIVSNKKLQWITSNEAVNVETKIGGTTHIANIAQQNNSSAPKLFKHVPLSWDKPVAKIIEKTNQNREPASPENCIYETVWTSPSVPPSNPVITSNPSLLLSRIAIDSKLPIDWESSIIDDENNLFTLLSKNSWSTVTLLSAGTEADVALGLRLLQHVSESSNLQIGQIVFITAPGSDADAGLFGLARTFRFERPDIRLRSIECTADKIPEAISLASTYATENELSIDKEGIVRVLRLRRYNHISARKKLSFHSDATYVISGGQGALGLVMAKFLVEHGAKYLLLLSRTPQSTDKLAEELLTLRKQANIECLACDVAEENSVQRARDWLQKNKWPTVRGVIHAAGVLTDGTIPSQSTDKLHLAFRPKVQGARNLRSVFTPPDFLLMFSSVAATFGLVGQGSYAAANTTIDALAQTWSQAGESVLSVQWGAWSDAGMAVRHDTVKRAEVEGFGSISNALGTAVLERLLAADKRGTVCVSPIDWSRLALDIPLFSRFQKQNISTETKKSSVDLLAIVRQAVADAMRMPVPDDLSLVENGLDSLGSVSLRNRIASTLNVDLPARFVIECPDINSMVRYLAALSPRNVSPVAQNSIVSSDLPVLVIGAGIGGLSFARELEKAGVSTVVMDASDRVGGVWDTLANVYSKLQIDSPAYDFDSTLIPSPGNHSWKTTFPQQPEIIAGCESAAAALSGPLYLSTRVHKVHKVGDAEYEVTYQSDGHDEQRISVSGVAAMIGGLHRPRLHSFPNEEAFDGYIGLGVANETPLKHFNGSSVVILGHGAFAVENMRTALENGAKHVTILCRQQNLVFSTFCTWLLNSSKGTLSINDIIDVVRPFYEACGMNVEDLPALTRSETGELTLDQATLPPASDLYFLAKLLGKLTVVIGEVDHFTTDGVVTKDGKKIAADMVLKCLGSHRDESILTNIFGENSNIQGLWINGDPNLFTYNDGAQVPRNIKSLVCGSYAFFVQAFVPAYLNLRQRREEFERVMSRINSDSAATTNTERVLFELWNFVEPAKRIVAERTAELCPFERFQLERETEWKNYSRMLGATEEKGKALWELLRPALSIMQRRNPRAPTETRNQYPSLGLLSVFVPHHRRVLFLPGQGTNARLARALLERTGWIGRSDLDFVVPDAPHEMPAFTNELQLKRIGLDGLVSVGLYDKSARYREWRAGFDALWDNHQEGKPIQITDSTRNEWNVSLSYLREIVRRHGPFDGIAGFCEGAAVASVALHLQARGEDFGLGSIRFFVAMSPWRSPTHQLEGMFRPNQPLQLPMLQIVGENDMEVFLEAAPHFIKDFAGASEFRHGGQHVYPPFTPGLELKLRQLLSTSDKISTSWIQ